MPPPPQLKHAFVQLAYTCTGCQKTSVTYWVEVDAEQGWLWKVGQAPPWDIGIVREVELALGADAELLKKAKVCLSQSYGLGACAYLRRVFENQIDALLRGIREMRAAAGATASQLRRLDDAIASRTFDEKTKAAYREAPKSLVVDGTNPFRVLHDELSRGLHGRDEDACTATAQKIITSLEYVVVQLRQQRAAREGFVASMRSLTKDPRRVMESTKRRAGRRTDP